MKKDVDKLKPIYSDDYYRMAKLVRDPKFKKRVKDMLAWYARIGAPLPKPKLTYNEYLDWLNLFWAAFTKVENGELALEKKRIIEDPDIPEKDKYWKILDAQNRLEPPPPGHFIDNLLEEFEYDRKNKKYKEFLEGHIFRGKEFLSEPLFHTRAVRDPKTDQFEFFIQLEPHTRLEHIVALWPHVEEYQKHMPSYVGKNKPWATFERDLEIYHAYKKAEKQMAKNSKRQRPGNKGNRRPLDYLVSEMLRRKYPTLTLSAIRKAASRVNALDSHPSNDPP